MPCEKCRFMQPVGNYKICQDFFIHIFLGKKFINKYVGSKKPANQDFLKKA